MKKKDMQPLAIIILGLLLLLNCARTKRPISHSEMQKAMVELVLRAKAGDKGALSELEKIALADTKKSQETKRRKHTFCWATMKHPDSLFVAILIDAYKAEDDHAIMRYLLGSITQHYDFAPDAFLNLFEEELEISEDSLGIDLVAQRTVSTLLHVKEGDKLFPILDRLTNEKARRFIMRYLALKVGGNFYKSEFSEYVTVAGKFPPCDLESISYFEPSLAELIIMNDSLNREQCELLIAKLYDKKGIFWTILGLLRENDEALNETLIKWIDDAPDDFGPYKMLVFSKLGSKENSVALAGKLAYDNIQDCKRCLYYVAGHIESTWEEKEAPEEIKEFGRWIARGAILGELSARNFPGTRILITGPGILSKKHQDAVYLYFSSISIDPFEIEGKDVIFVKDKNYYDGLRELQNPKGMVVSITLKWYKNWIIVGLGNSYIPPSGLGGGWQKLLFKKIDGEWRFATRLEMVIS